jgi:hypothetical protein
MGSKRRFKPHRVQYLNDTVFTEIERELGLTKPNEKLRKRLNLSVSLYLWDRQRITPRWAEVRKRLDAVGVAALNLYKKLNEDPVEAAARAAMYRVSDGLLKGRTAAGSKFFVAMRKEAEKLPDSRFKTYCLNLFGERKDADNSKIDDEPNEREVLWQIKALVRRKVGIDLDIISAELDRLWRFVGSLKRSEGGRPGDWAWKALMSDLAKAYQEATGNKATVTENEHRAAAGKRYSGQFVRAAAILDRETAALCITNVKPRTNGALGPALRRLVEPRPVRRRSKTH